MQKEFAITDGKGFQLRFPNGWTISTQFGRYNYCEVRDYTAGWEDKEAGASDTAEIAAWPRSGKFCRHVIRAESDDVIGWKTTMDFIQIANRVADMGEACAACSNQDDQDKIGELQKDLEKARTNYLQEVKESESRLNDRDYWKDKYQSLKNHPDAPTPVITTSLKQQIRSYGLRKIDAIKYVRASQNIGLKDSKDIVDQVLAEPWPVDEMNALHSLAQTQDSMITNKFRADQSHFCAKCGAVFYCRGNDCDRYVRNPHPMVCGGHGDDEYYGGAWDRYKQRKEAR